MPQTPLRKPNRLANYDYSQNGAYFITFCTKGRQELLSSIGEANCVRPTLTSVGELVENELVKLSTVYGSVTLEKYVIMPNHVHMIILIYGAEQTGTTVKVIPTVSRIIKQFKGAITKQLGQSIWQTSFHDHIIRNESDYLRIWKYIEENPILWAEDCFNDSSHANCDT